MPFGLWLLFWDANGGALHFHNHETPPNPEGTAKMTQPWQKPLMAVRKSECQDYLAEAAAADDLDLLEELAAKMNDVMVVWRRSQSQQPPTTFTFSDGVTRHIDEMAFAHAVAHYFPDLDDDDEIAAAFVMRREAE